MFTQLRAVARGMTAEEILSTLQTIDERSYVDWMRSEFARAGKADIPDRELRNLYQVTVHILLSRLENLRTPQGQVWN